MKLDYPSPVLNLQAASAAPTLIRASKTFTGAANLGAVGVNELFTTTGAVLLEGFWARCTSDLVDAVDGALFTLGVTGTPNRFGNFTGAYDLDTTNEGDFLEAGDATATDGYGNSLAQDSGNRRAIVDNIIMTISAQAITGGTLAFYILYLPLSSDGALTLGAGMTAI